MIRITPRAIAAAAALTIICAVSGCTPGGKEQAPDPNITVESNIPYTGADGEDLQADACLPTGSGPHAAVVLVHGGAFKEGDRRTMSGICRALGDQGFAAFAVDYRLLPATYPAQIDDVMASVSWLREPQQIERFNLSGSVAILGSSAGAIIALSAAEKLKSASTPVNAVVALSPAASLTADAAQLGNPRPDLEVVVREYLGCEDIADCAIAAEASPVEAANLLPPTLIVHGSEDLIPLEQAELLDQTLQQAGVEHDLIVVDGQRHGLQLLNDSTRPEILDFLRKHAE